MGYPFAHFFIKFLVFIIFNQKISFILLLLIISKSFKTVIFKWFLNKIVIDFKRAIRLN